MRSSTLFSTAVNVGVKEICWIHSQNYINESFQMIYFWGHMNNMFPGPLKMKVGKSTPPLPPYSTGYERGPEGSKMNITKESFLQSPQRKQISVFVHTSFSCNAKLCRKSFAHVPGIQTDFLHVLLILLLFLIALLHISASLDKSV